MSKSLGEEIKGRLKARNQKQKQLANFIGMSRSQLCEIIGGVRRITPSQALKIEDFFRDENLAYTLLLIQMEYDLSEAKCKYKSS